MKNQKHADIVLDKQDIQILKALQKDASASHQVLGEKIFLSGSQVSRRVNKMQAAGIIGRTVVLLNPSQIGLSVRAITYVSLARHGDEEGRAFEKGISAMPEVLECYSVTGDSDYVLHIVAADLNELSESVLRRLTRLKGVNSIRSSIVLQSIKTSTELPLSQMEL